MPGSSEAPGAGAGAGTGGLTVPTPVGPARIHVAAAAGESPRAILVAGHGAGAGAGVQARDLVALRRALPARGIEVVVVEQPWLVAGRRVAAAPKQLDEAWLAVIEALSPQAPPAHPARPGEPVRPPLVLAGRSAGARVACRTAAAAGAAGVVALAFPLHPPGRPERSRLDELIGAGVPTLVVQGERDTFGRPGDFPAGPDQPFRLRPVPGADHGFAVLKAGPVGQDEALALLVSEVTSWLDDLLDQAGPAG
jgi:predicted alpha/beta-hydrolase family hydrolase